MALTDEEAEQIAQQIEDRQKTEKRTAPLANLTSTTKLLLGVAIVIIIWFMFSKNLTQTQKIGLLIISGIAVVMFMGYGEQPRRMLTDRELVSRAYELLKWKQSHHLGGYHQVPQGRIKVDIESVPEFRDGKILFWRRRAWIVPTGKRAIEYELRQDPYDGDLRGVIERPEGFSGADTLQKETVYGKDIWQSIAGESYKERFKK